MHNNNFVGGGAEDGLSKTITRLNYPFLKMNFFALLGPIPALGRGIDRSIPVAAPCHLRWRAEA